MVIRGVRGRAQAVVVTSALWVLLQLVVTAALFLRGQGWVQAYRADELSDPILGGHELWALPQVVAIVAAWACTSRWLSQVRTNADVVDADAVDAAGVADETQEISRDQIWRAWIVPVSNLWVPYRLVADAARTTIRAGRGRAAADELRLHAWWATYVLAFALFLVPHGYALGVEGALVKAQALSAVACGVLIIGVVLWIRLVWRVTDAQDDLVVVSAAARILTQAQARGGLPDRQRPPNQPGSSQGGSGMDHR